LDFVNLFLNINGLVSFLIPPDSGELKLRKKIFDVAAVAIGLGETLG
jgi:hypothetical protein